MKILFFANDGGISKCIWKYKWSLNTLQPLNNQVIGDSIINGLRSYPSVWRTFLNNIKPLTH